MFEDAGVGRGHPPPPQLRVGDDQAIEGIVRPPDLGGAEEPRAGWRLIDQPSIVFHDPLRSRLTCSEPAGLLQNLQFEQGRRRHVQAVASGDKGA